MVLQCRFSFIRLFFRGWKTISIFNNGWFFSCNYGYHVSIFSKIDCNDFSFFRMENLNKDIFWSRFVLKIVAWSAVPGRNRTIAECIAWFCIFICTFQINKYLSCNGAWDSEGELPFEAGSYWIWRLFVSGDNIKREIAGGVIVFVADRWFQAVCRKD